MYNTVWSFQLTTYLSLGAASGRSNYLPTQTFERPPAARTIYLPKPSIRLWPLELPTYLGRLQLALGATQTTYLSSLAHRAVCGCGRR